MKKTTLLVIMFAVIQLSMVAQKLYFKGQIGYDFGFLKSQMDLNSYNIVDYYDSTTSSGSYQSCKNSYATGISFNAGLGIMLNKYLGVELTGYYTGCREQKFGTEISVQDVDGYHFNTNGDLTEKGSSYGLKPSLTFTLPGKELRPYTRIGTVLSFIKMNETMKMNGYTNNPNYIPYDGIDYTLQYKMRLSVGVNAALGMEYMIMDRMWLFAEVEGNIVNYIPVSATFTNYVVSRQDVTDKLTVHEREINFVKSYSDADNKSANEPTKMLPVHYSFSSIGINFGLKYTLFD
jgi:hypothetical protein